MLFGQSHYDQAWCKWKKHPNGDQELGDKANARITGGGRGYSLHNPLMISDLFAAMLPVQGTGGLTTRVKCAIVAMQVD